MTDVGAKKGSELEVNSKSNKTVNQDKDGSQRNDSLNGDEFDDVQIPTDIQGAMNNTKNDKEPTSAKVIYNTDKH